MPKLCVLLFALFLGNIAFSQVEISGVINEYSKITSAFKDTCQSWLEVDDASELMPDDLVLIIQMRSAGINTTNNSSFGNIVVMNQAGLYELNEIDSISGNIVYLKYQLSYQYLPLFDAQLVRVPVFQNAEIVDTLTAVPWNGDIGGICALKVEGQLFMEGIIDVSGMGFRGGDATITVDNDCNWINPQNDFVYAENTWRGAEKGEGIAGLNGPDLANGKGAIATGGGGGNDHNAGGGGGANVTNGGNGGKNFEPSFFGCSGLHPGVGGKVVPDYTNRLFLGSGGGAGHENNGNGTDGGAGGGIVILIANEFYPLGASIYAEGETPPDGGGDGAGGGGAGGTILLEVQTIQTTVHLEVSGGDGGLIDNGLAERCHGPGGGGSGGRIISNLNNTTDPVEMLVNGGQAGLSINSASCPDGTNDGTNGEEGVIELLDEIIVSTDTFHFPFADFDYIINGLEVEFINQSHYTGSISWDFGDMNTSAEIDPIHEYANSGTYPVSLIVENDCGSDTIVQNIMVEILVAPEALFTADQESGCVPLTVQFSDASLGSIDAYNWFFEGGSPMNSILQNPEVTYNSAGIYDVQLIVNGPGGADTLNLEDIIEVFDLPTAAFNFTTNDLNVDFSNLSQNADNVNWDFGDMSNSMDINPSHVYSMNGTYDVQLIVSNQCGSDTINQTITVEASNSNQAAFTFDDGNGCAPWLVQFEDLSSGNFDTWLWTFEGGTPANSIEMNPQVLYTTPGLYDVQLEVSGNQGSDLVLLEDIIEIAPAVDTDFDFTINEAEVSFFNNSINATDYQWDFGDNSPFSNEINPVHTYSAPGTYEVTLVATSEFCGKAITKTIFLEYTSVEDLNETTIKFYPNPVKEKLLIETGSSGLSSFKIYHLDGREVLIGDQSFRERTVVDLEQLLPSVYVLVLQNGSKTFHFKIVKI